MEGSRLLRLVLLATFCLAASLPTARAATSTGYVSPAIGSWGTSTNGLVGSTGTGTVTVSSGTLRSSTCDIGYASGPSYSGTVTVSGYSLGTSTWINGSDLYVGYNSAGTLDIYNGAQVTCGGNAYFANSSASTGTVNVSGVTNGHHATWTVDDSVYLDGAGGGTLNITNGGLVNSCTSACAYNVYIGQGGAATVDGSGSTWNVVNGQQTLFIGYNSGTGTLNITNGGNVSCGYVWLACAASGPTGVVKVDGAGSKWTINDVLYGGSYSNAATLNITNGGSVNHSATSSSTGYVGGGSTVTVDGANSHWTNSGGAIDVGCGYGNGNMSITNGGAVTSLGGLISSNGTVTVTGAANGVASTWNNGSGALSVGGGWAPERCRSATVVSSTAAALVPSFGAAQRWTAMARRGPIAVPSTSKAHTATGRRWTSPTVVPSIVPAPWYRLPL